MNPVAAPSLEGLRPGWNQPGGAENVPGGWMSFKDPPTQTLPWSRVQVKIQQVDAADTDLSPEPSPGVFQWPQVKITIPMGWQWGFVGNGVRLG